MDFWPDDQPITRQPFKMERYMQRCFVLAGFLFVSIMAAAANDADIPLLSIKGTSWTSDETTYIKALHQRGSITIATKVSTAIYMPEADGSISGFHYSVMKDFAGLLNISINKKIVSWDEYFYKSGEDLAKIKADKSYTYTPSLLESVDLYVDGFTVLDWREKMFDIIKFVPSRQMIVSRKGNKPNNIDDLNNKVFAMISNTSMKGHLEKIKADNQVTFTYLDVDSFDDMDRFVSEGKADFTVYDSDRAFVALGNYENLTIVWPISDIQIMGWAVNKNNPVLKSILEKYMSYALEEAVLDKYWKLSYGVTFVEYLQVLGLGGLDN